MMCASVGHHRAHMSGFSQIILSPRLYSWNFLLWIKKLSHGVAWLMVGQVCGNNSFVQLRHHLTKERKGGVCFLQPEFAISAIQMKSHPNVWFCHINQVPKKLWSKKVLRVTPSWSQFGAPKTLFSQNEFLRYIWFGSKSFAGWPHRLDPPPATPWPAQAPVAGRHSPFSIIQVTEAWHWGACFWQTQQQQQQQKISCKVQRHQYHRATPASPRPINCSRRWSSQDLPTRRSSLPPRSP